MLDRGNSVEVISSSTLSLALSLCCESFVAELSICKLAGVPHTLIRERLRVETADVFELLENISSGSEHRIS
jgi:hypothetical protein